MNNLKVALLQLFPTGTLQGNLEKGMEACKKAKELGADIALFPEMWSTGYSIPTDATDLRAASISLNSDFVQKFAALARELEMAICLTILEQYDPSPRNTVVLFDRFGKQVLIYAKVHTCDFSPEEHALTPGDDFCTADLDTAQGILKVGAMICYDREQPESARILMLKGAEIILVPNACPMEINRLSQLRGRAYENMLGIATVNYPKGHPDCNGHSSAFDGIAYNEHGWRDTLIAEAGEGECICIAEFPIDQIRAYRKREIHGNAYRHPQKYRLLISEEINEPFVRSDHRP